MDQKIFNFITELILEQNKKTPERRKQIRTGTNLYKAVLEGFWDGITYPDMVNKIKEANPKRKKVSKGYLESIGSQILSSLRKALDDQTINKTNVQTAIKKAIQKNYCEQQNPTEQQNLTNQPPHLTYYDIQEVPPIISHFIERETELEDLKKLINNNTQLIALLGMSGLGKSTLAVKLMETMENEFECVIWKRLTNDRPFANVLTSMIERGIPLGAGQGVSQLMELLQNHRCLLILDDLESIMREDSSGDFSEEYREYGDLLKQVGTRRHQSCLLIISCDIPNSIKELLEKPSVYTYKVPGFQVEEIKQFLRTIEVNLSGSDDEWTRFRDYVGGNPSLVKLTASMIRTLRSKDLSHFFNEIDKYGIENPNVTNKLEPQFRKFLLDEEKEIVYWLAINFERVSYDTLNKDIFSTEAQRRLYSNLENLRIKTWINENNESHYTLIELVKNYVLDKIIENICAEIINGNLNLFKSHALMKTKAKSSIRSRQVSKLIQPVFDKLVEHYRTKEEVENRLQEILRILRGEDQSLTGYAAANIINLLVKGRIQKSPSTTNLTDYDFSNITIRQADFQGVKLYKTKFCNTNLVDCIFSNSLGSVLSIDFHPEGKYLAVNDITGKIYIFDIQETKLAIHKVFTAHDSGWIWGIKFSPDGSFLFSGGDDKKIKIWDFENILNSRYMCINSATYSIECDSTIRDLSIFPEQEGNRFLVSAHDGDIKIWNYNDNQNHPFWSYPYQNQNRVRSVAVNPKKPNIFASGGEDNMVTIWSIGDWQTQPIQQYELTGHEKEIRALCWSRNGKFLASAGSDHKLLIWTFDTFDTLNPPNPQKLGQHENWIRSVSFSKDGKYLVSADENGTIKLWDVQNNRLIKTHENDHNCWVNSVKFHPSDETIFVSAGTDHKINKYKISNNKNNKIEKINEIKGYTNFIFSIAFNPNGEEFAVGYEDAILRVWNLDRVLKTEGRWGDDDRPYDRYYGHKNWIRTVTYHPKEKNLLASSGADKKIILWKREGKEYQKLEKLKFIDSVNDDCRLNNTSHGSWIRKIGFNPEYKILASCSDDKTIKIWAWGTGELIQTLTGHKDWIRTLDFSPDGKYLVSGSGDKTIKIWERNAENGRWKGIQTLTEQEGGHTDWIWCVTFSPDGQYLATSSGDATIKIWKKNTERGKWECFQSLEEHEKSVRVVAFNQDGSLLASGSTNRTVIIWNTNTWQPIYRPENNNIILRLNHDDWVRSLAFGNRQDKEYLVTTSQDGTIKLWDVKALKNGQDDSLTSPLKVRKLYQGMDISGVTELTDGEKETLKVLGQLKET